MRAEVASKQKFNVEVVAYLKGQEDLRKEQTLLATQRYMREKMEGALI